MTGVKMTAAPGKNTTTPVRLVSWFSRGDFSFGHCSRFLLIQNFKFQNESLYCDWIRGTGTGVTSAKYAYLAEHWLLTNRFLNYCRH